MFIYHLSSNFVHQVLRTSDCVGWMNPGQERTLESIFLFWVLIKVNSPSTYSVQWVRTKHLSMIHFVSKVEKIQTVLCFCFSGNGWTQLQFVFPLEGIPWHIPSHMLWLLKTSLRMRSPEFSWGLSLSLQNACILPTHSGYLRLSSHQILALQMS